MTVRVGISFPQTTIGTDPSIIRDFVQAVEGAGYNHITAVDHVLGAHPDRFTRPLAGLTAPPYTTESVIHEVFALFGYFAALTERLEFATSILVLPQRQTQLVAKQAAEVDVLSGGRMRLGIGVGWNYAEFEGMGEDFHIRGRRMEEQIEVLRRLWTEPLVNFEGRWHTLDRLSINPRPVQRSIPIWIGCGATEPLLRRVARLADGWMPRQIGQPGEDFSSVLERLYGQAREAGRDPSTIGIDVRLSADLDRPDDWLKRAEEMEGLGVSHITLSIPRDGLTPAQLVQAVPRYKRLLTDHVPNLAG
jgi:probable F420-dependent oxidoreductase